MISDVILSDDLNYGLSVMEVGTFLVLNQGFKGYCLAIVHIWWKVRRSTPCNMYNVYRKEV